MAFKNIFVAVTGDASSLRTSMIGASRDVQGFDKSVKGANATLSRSKAIFLGVAGAMGVLAAGGLAYGVVKSIEFEKKMRNVNSISKLNEEQFYALKDAALELSTEVPQSAAVLADGLYDIASAGFQGREGLMVLDASARSAAAGMTDTAVSAKAITGVINGYGLAASDASDISDILFATVEQGVLTFEELASESGDLIGIGQAAGVSFDQMAAGLATITKAGVPAAQASTALARTVQSLIDPSDELASIMSDLGYESGETMLQQLGLQETMMMVSAETDGSAESMLKLFPNIRAARGAFALLSNEGRTWEEVSGRVVGQTNRAGAAQKALEEQSKSLAFQWEMFTSSVTAGAIRAGDMVLPVLADLLGMANRLVDEGLPNMIDAAGALKPTWDALVDVGGDLHKILATLWGAIEPLAGALAGLVLGATVKSLNALAQALSAVTGFVADNEAAIGALAFVIALTLAPAIQTAITKFGVMLAMGLVNGIGAIGSATAGMAAAFTGASLSAAALNIAIAAVAVGAGLAIKEIADLKAEMRDLAQERLGAFGQQFDESTLGNMQRMRAQLDGTRESMSGLREGVGDFNYWAEGISTGFSKVLPFLTTDSEAKWEEFLAMDSAVAEVEEGMLQMLGTTNAAMREIEGQLGQRLSPEAIYELADAIGIDLATAAREDAVPALVEAALAAQEGDDAYSGATTAIDELADAHTTAVKAMKDFVDQQRAMLDPIFAVYDAVGDLADAQDEANEAMLEHGADSEEYAEATRDVADAIMDRDAAMADLAEGIRTGVVSEDAAIDALNRWTQTGDITEEQMRLLTDAFEDVFGKSDEWNRTTSEASITADNEEAIREFQGAQREANTWDGWMATANISADNSNAMARFRQAEARATNWSGRSSTSYVKANTSNALYGISVARRELSSIDGRKATITIDARMSSADRAMLNSARAYGYADGGILRFANGTENHLAEIAPAGAMRLWAEPETGGEAYIPLAPHKRVRSTAILEEVARQFGFGLSAMANGGPTPAGGRAVASRPPAADVTLRVASDRGNRLTRALAELVHDGLITVEASRS